jgi:hypothetical protein
MPDAGLEVYGGRLEWVFDREHKEEMEFSALGKRLVSDT